VYSIVVVGLTRVTILFREEVSFLRMEAVPGGAKSMASKQPFDQIRGIFLLLMVAFSCRKDFIGIALWG